MKELRNEFETMNLEVVEPDKKGKIINTTNIMPKLVDKIRETQEKFAEEGKEHKLSKRSDNLMEFGTRIRISNQRELKEEILHETHNSRYSVHPVSTKMYQDSCEQLCAHVWKKK